MWNWEYAIRLFSNIGLRDLSSLLTPAICVDRCSLEGQLLNAGKNLLHYDKRKDNTAGKGTRYRNSAETLCGIEEEGFFAYGVMSLPLGEDTLILGITSEEPL